MLQTIDEGKIILTKFRENFFIKDLMEETKEKKSKGNEEEVK